jgi:hypothetical protein
MTVVDVRPDTEVVSAHGGSARSQLDQLDERSWKPHPFIGFTIGAISFVVPFVAAIVAIQLLVRVVPRPTTVPPFVAWLVMLGVVATAVLWFVDAQARRLLPLAMMLRLSLVFPDHAPSRFSSALRSGSGRALERAVERATTQQEFATSQSTAELVLDLLGALSKHDRLTRGHCERVRAYADLIGQQMGLDPESQAKLHWAALLHDVGKLDVPAEILNKKGRLNDDEWRIIRGHPGGSDKWLVRVEPWLGEWALAASQHHERYDGDGYPNGLKGDEISLAGRIVAVADAFDVMTAARSYKKPFPAAQARTELANNAGTQFDPRVVRAFLAISLGRLRLVMGPLAWLAGVVPGLVAVGGAAATSAGTVVTAAAVTASGFVAAPSPEFNLKPDAVVVEQPAASPPAAGGDPAIANDDSSRTGDDGSARGATTIDDPEARSPATTRGRTTATTLPGSGGGSNTVDPDDDPASDRDDTNTTPTTALNPTTPTTVTGPVVVPSDPVATGDHKPTVNDDKYGPVLLGTRVRVDVLANDSDVDGDLDKDTLEILQGPAASQVKSVQVSSNEIDVRPALLFSGPMTIVYKVCDTAGNCARGTLVITFVLSL